MIYTPKNFKFIDVFKLVKNELESNHIMMNDKMIKTEFIFISLLTSFERIKVAFSKYKPTTKIQTVEQFFKNSLVN